MKLLHGVEWWKWDEEIKDDVLMAASTYHNGVIVWVVGDKVSSFFMHLLNHKGMVIWDVLRPLALGWIFVRNMHRVSPTAAVQLHYEVHEEYTQVIAQEVINHDTFLCHHWKSRNLWVISFWHIGCDELTRLCFCNNIYTLLKWS